MALRRRLDLMGYQDMPLGLDSAPLVQQMMEDLISDTEAMKENEEELAKLREKVELLESQIEPLQNENTRLTRENVQLHQQLVEAKEEAMNQRNNQSTEAFELHAENRRLKLLNQKAALHVKEMAKQIDEMKQRLQQSIAAPSMMKIPETVEADPRKMRGRRTAASSRAASVVSSEAMSVFSAPQVSFDPNMFNVELENLRKERDAARQEAKETEMSMDDVENMLKVRDDEIQRLGADLQRETGKDGYMVSLRHKYEQQKAEIEKLKAQVRAVNPRSTSFKAKPLVLTPPRTTVSIQGEEPIQNDSLSELDPRGHVTFTHNYSPIQETRMMSESSTTFDMSIDEYEEEEDVPQPKAPIAPEPMPGEQVEKHSSEEQSEKEVQEKLDAMKEKQRQKKQLLKEKMEKRKRKVRVILKEKNDEIDRLRQEVETLTAKIEEQEKALAKMASDFAFVGDNVATLVSEKDAIIEDLRTQTNKPPEVIIDNEKVDVLQLELDELRIKHEEELQKRDKQIEQLQALAQTLAQNTSPVECKECIRLRQQLDDVMKTKQSADSASESEIKKLRERAAQLEVLIRASQDQQRDSTALDAQLQRARNQLTEKDAQMDELRATVASQQAKITSYQCKLEECERKIRGVPDIEQKYRSVVDELKTEQAAMGSELKKKSVALKTVGDRLSEYQRQIRELQRQLEKSREEASGAREEAAFHRAKSEQVTQKLSQQTTTVIRDANASVQHLQRQLHEKTKESALYQKLLSEARKQLAMSEVTIPSLKQQVSKLEKDREDLVKRARRLGQLAQYVETSMSDVDQSADSVAFSAALHQLQDELKKYNPEC